VITDGCLLDFPCLYRSRCALGDASRTKAGTLTVWVTTVQGSRNVAGMRLCARHCQESVGGKGPYERCVHACIRRTGSALDSTKRVAHTQGFAAHWSWGHVYRDVMKADGSVDPIVRSKAQYAAPLTLRRGFPPGMKTCFSTEVNDATHIPTIPAARTRWDVSRMAWREISFGCVFRMVRSSTATHRGICSEVASRHMTGCLDTDWEVISAG
jgi:hypothetical protein